MHIFAKTVVGHLLGSKCQIFGRILEFFCNFFVFSNQNEANLNVDFYLFLHSLGSIVDVKKHHGWTGNFETSWKIVQTTSSLSETSKKPISKQINELNGLDYILYWSDITSEIAFILPNSSKPLAANTVQQTLASSQSTSTSQNTTTTETSQADAQNQGQVQPEDIQKKIQFYASEVKLIVVWLEQMQDLDSIPTSI
jgi:hypothetical protein